MSESKREKFVRIMQKRINRIKREHRLIGNLANKYHYDYDLAMINQVEDELVRDLEYHLNKFTPARDEIKPFQFRK